MGFLSRFLVGSICALALVGTCSLAGATSSKASAARISAHLTKTSFKSSQAGSVKLIYKFSAKSTRFSYLLSFKKGSKWQTVKSVKKNGSFKGSKSTTVKKVFAGKSIKVGSYRLKLSADSGRTLLGFKVVAAAPVPEPAKIVVDQDGFTAVADPYATGETDVSWGAVLENTSPDAAAADTTVTVNMLDASNLILGTDTEYIHVINPSSHFYLGDDAWPSRPGTVTALQLIVQTGQSVYKSVVLPSITNVAFSQDNGFNGLHVVGELSNTTGAVVSLTTEISAVVFDASGKIVGGDITYPDADVPAGTSIGFDIEIGVSSIPFPNVASASVSVDGPWTP